MAWLRPLATMKLCTLLLASATVAKCHIHVTKGNHIGTNTSCLTTVHFKIMPGQIIWTMLIASSVVGRHACLTAIHGRKSAPVIYCAQLIPCTLKSLKRRTMTQPSRDCQFTASKPIGILRVERPSGFKTSDFNVTSNQVFVRRLVSQPFQRFPERNQQNTRGICPGKRLHSPSKGEYS